ncbi:MAG: glycosyltransferase [Candidatus Omnitrophica bacterium]|nr:glycosyltransferase [Candidatus Omnitrophota bacterium]
MKVSILIPIKADNKNLRECIENCLLLDYPDFEIIILPDEPVELPYRNKVRVVPTGKVGPAQKRDLAVKGLESDILAFLDDDAFPRRDWLRNAVVYFKDPDVAVVCGPAVTPEDDGLRRKASGFVYSSFLVSGPHMRRYIPKFRCDLDDYPSCNFLIRRDVFEKIGGFDTAFWPGEDTVLCLKITKELKMKIEYDPHVLVYHHRRPLFIPHLKQIRNYALHRGYFAKRFPSTSLKISYFIPSFFILGLIAGGIIAIFDPFVRDFYLFTIALYVFLSLLYSFKQAGRLRLKFIVFAGIILTHLAYGVYFIKGLSSRRLKEEDDEGTDDMGGKK